MNIDIKDYYLVKPTDINLVSQTKYDSFYDIEVEDDNSFHIISNNDELLLVHNCDGTHIKGLLVNLFDVFWPELLKLDFIYEFVTPIVKVKKGSIVKYFYKLSDYRKWRDTVNTDSYFIKYYKGLGTIEPNESKEFFKNIEKHLIKFNYRKPEETHDLVDMVFNDERADDRKKWLLSYNPTNEIDKFANKTYYDSFINDEMIEFSMADNIRSIPSAIDGLKPTQRKILYTLFKNNYKDEVKVSILSGSVISTAAYHQGPVSLDQTIIGMAQDFVGSNNINLLQPAGEFGTRSKGGKDASASRYIFTNLMPITKYIFNQEDNAVLSYNYDDGLRIEPKIYVPIVPMVLINGAEGIGTGWSTKVPMYNINDIIEYLEKRIKGVKPKRNLVPYYRNFKGKITVDDEKCTTYGVFERVGTDKVKVTELPIGFWNDSFIDHLEKLIKSELVSDYIKNSTDNNVEVIVTIPKLKTEGMSDDDIVTNLKLSTNINLTNMKLFDSNHKIKSYNDIYEIIEEHHDVRMAYYGKRKQYILDKLQREIDMMSNKMKFIDLVVKNKIIVNNTPKVQIVDKIKSFGLVEIDGGYDYLLNMPIYSLTEERIKDLNTKIQEKINEKVEVENVELSKMWLNDLSELKRKLK